ncbi:hypothetical protein F1654_10030 [Alkalicaulis satelles]|uniref:Uncharacterized protein n=1 Tax=Alkalicaulis satelles TaxID=2609175 RepID=A0A5M6ZIX8_9PROT|nr:hypothetical protein [Alkalicaulis satelles]KAA5802171.1 hypothetical protein F1654_10030 [Alkalicaulis satelles]
MIRSGVIGVMAALAALAAGAQAQDGGDEAGIACVDFTAFEFDLFEAGAVLSAPAFERPEARADFAVFADGSVITIAADFCIEPVFEVTASFTSPAGLEAARERLSWLFAAVDIATGCNPGGNGADAVEAAALALGEGRDVEAGEAPLHETQRGAVFLAATQDSGRTLASLTCEDNGAPAEDNGG